MGYVWTIKVVLELWFCHQKCHFLWSENSHFSQKCPSLRKQTHIKIQFPMKIQVCESLFWFLNSWWALLVTLAKNGGKNRLCHADYLEMLSYSRLNFPDLSVKKIAFITEVIKSTIENKIASIFCVIQLYLLCEKYFY